MIWFCVYNLSVRLHLSFLRDLVQMSCSPRIQSKPSWPPKAGTRVSTIKPWVPPPRSWKRITILVMLSSLQNNLERSDSPSSEGGRLAGRRVACSSSLLKEAITYSCSIIPAEPVMFLWRKSVFMVVTERRVVNDPQIPEAALYIPSMQDDGLRVGRVSGERFRLWATKAVKRSRSFELTPCLIGSHAKMLCLFRTLIL